MNETTIKEMRLVLESQAEELKYLRTMLYELEAHYFTLLQHLHLRPTHVKGEYALEQDRRLPAWLPEKEPYESSIFKG